MHEDSASRAQFCVTQPVKIIVYLFDFSVLLHCIVAVQLCVIFDQITSQLCIHGNQPLPHAVNLT